MANAAEYWMTFLPMLPRLAEYIRLAAERHRRPEVAVLKWIDGVRLHRMWRRRIKLKPMESDPIDFY